MKIIDKILGGIFPNNKRLTTDDNQVDNEIENVIRDAGLTLEAEVSLTGTSSSVGTAITGSGTQFLTELRVGDLFYKDSAKNDARRITNIASDLALTVDSAFASDFSGQACSIFNVTQLLTAIPLIIPQATETVKGIAEIATSAEAVAGSDDTRIITPAKLQDVVALINKKGIQYSSLPSERSIIQNAGDADHDIIANIGTIVFNDGSSIRNVGTPTKRIDANWQAGSGNGGFPSGISLTPSAKYHFFAIAKPDDTLDFGFDTSDTATNLLADATDYTRYSHRGWIIVDGSSNIRQFFMDENNRFILDIPIQETPVTVAVTTAVSFAITVPKNTIGIFNSFYIGTVAGVSYGLITETRQANSIPSAVLYHLYGYGAGGGDFRISNVEMQRKVDGSSQIRRRFNATGGTYEINVIGWYDLEIK